MGFGHKTRPTDRNRKSRLTWTSPSGSTLKCFRPTFGAAETTVASHGLAASGRSNIVIYSVSSVDMADSQFDSNLDNTFDQSDLNTVRRNKDRATYDKHQIADIVRQAKICHVSFVHDHLPQCIPMIGALDETAEGDLFVYFHGDFLCKSFVHPCLLASKVIQRLASSKPSWK